MSTIKERVMKLVCEQLGVKEEEVTPGEEDGGGEGAQEGGQEVMLVPNQARGVLKPCFRKSAP